MLDRPQRRRVLAWWAIMFGTAFFATSIVTSFGLWSYVGNRVVGWSVLIPDDESFVVTVGAIIGTVEFCVGSALLWFGIRELRANRRKSATP
jgi:hypothetical protein